MDSDDTCESSSATSPMEVGEPQQQGGATPMDEAREEFELEMDPNPLGIDQPRVNPTELDPPAEVNANLIDVNPEGINPAELNPEVEVNANVLEPQAQAASQPGPESMDFNPQRVDNPNPQTALPNPLADDPPAEQVDNPNPLADDPPAEQVDNPNPMALNPLAEQQVGNPMVVNPQEHQLGLIDNPDPEVLGAEGGAEVEPVAAVPPNLHAMQLNAQLQALNPNVFGLIPEIHVGGVHPMALMDQQVPVIIGNPNAIVAGIVAGFNTHRPNGMHVSSSSGSGTQSSSQASSEATSSSSGTEALTDVTSMQSSSSSRATSSLSGCSSVPSPLSFLLTGEQVPSPEPTTSGTERSEQASAAEQPSTSSGIFHREFGPSTSSGIFHSVFGPSTSSESFYGPSEGSSTSSEISEIVYGATGGQRSSTSSEIIYSGEGPSTSSGIVSGAGRPRGHLGVITGAAAAEAVQALGPYRSPSGAASYRSSDSSPTPPVLYTGHSSVSDSSNLSASDSIKIEDPSQRIEELPDVLIRAANNDEEPRHQIRDIRNISRIFRKFKRQTLNQFLEDAVESLNSVIAFRSQQLNDPESVEVLEEALLALGTVAQRSAHDRFQHYFSRCIPSLRAIIDYAGAKELRALRGKALECFGLLVQAADNWVSRDGIASEAEFLLDNLTQLQYVEVNDPQAPHIMVALRCIAFAVPSRNLEHSVARLGHLILRVVNLAELSLFDGVPLPRGIPRERGEVDPAQDHWTRFLYRPAPMNLQAFIGACRLVAIVARRCSREFAPFAEATARRIMLKLQFRGNDEVRFRSAESLNNTLISFRSIPGIGERAAELATEMCQLLIQALAVERAPGVAYCQIESLSWILRTSQERSIPLDTLPLFGNSLEQVLRRFLLRRQHRVSARVPLKILLHDSFKDLDLMNALGLLLDVVLSRYEGDFLDSFDCLIPHFVAMLDMREQCINAAEAIREVFTHGGPNTSRYLVLVMEPLRRAIFSNSPVRIMWVGKIVTRMARNVGEAFAVACGEYTPLIIQNIIRVDARSEPAVNAREHLILALTMILEHNPSRIYNREEAFSVWMSVLPVWRNRTAVHGVLSYFCQLLEGRDPELLGPDNRNLARIRQIVHAAFYYGAVIAESYFGEIMKPYI